jgi:DNA-binding LacI/PurR family transcriptional regulator
MYLTDKPLHLSEPLEKEILTRLALRCRGWQFSHANFPFHDSTQPRQSWDNVLADGKPDHLVVASGRVALARWAHGHDIRTLFVGGGSGELRIPSIAVSAISMLDQALARLVGLGHHHIVLPLCCRQEGFMERLRECFARRLALSGLGYSPQFHTPSHPETGPAVLRGLLEKAARVRPPTALILLDWREAIAALGWLRDAGRAVPGDVSLIVLSENPDMAWHQPAIAHFPYPVGGLVARIHRWLEGGPPYPGEQEVMAAKLVAGESIAPLLTSAQGGNRGRGR